MELPSNFKSILEIFLNYMINELNIKCMHVFIYNSEKALQILKIIKLKRL